MSNSSLRLVAHIHPFAPQSRIETDIEAGPSVAQIVGGLGIRAGTPLVFLDGAKVEAEDWAATHPEAGAHLVVKVVPAGNRDDANSAFQGGGKTSAAGLGLFVLGLVLLPFTGGASMGLCYLGGAMMAGGLLTAVGGAVALAYHDVVDALNGEGIGQNNNLGIRGGSNAMPQLGTKIPVVLGKHLVVPYYAAKPYTSIGGTDGENQSLTMLFCIGAGPLRVTNIKIGENALISNSAAVSNGALTVDGNYTGVSAQLYQDGTNPSLYPVRVIEDAPNLELKSNVEKWLTTAPRTNQISCDITLPGGLYAYADGEKEDHTVTIEARYRVAGTGLAFASSTLIGTMTITRQVSRTMRFNFISAVDNQNTYEVCLRRNTADDGDDFNGTSVVQWSTLRSINTLTAPVDASVRGNYVFLALQILATRQLNGVVSTLNCVAESYYPAYDGAGTGTAEWPAAYSQNPAAAFLWALRGPLNPRPVPDELIDWARLESWFATCATNGWTCNAVVGSGERLQDVLNKIASTGRAQLTIRDGLYSVVVDEPRTAIVQHFTPRNVKNFSWTKAFADLPLGLRCTFISEADGWDRNERVVPVDGYSEATAETKLQASDFWGITSSSLVFKHARYRLAVAILRPELFTFETDPEGLVCELGDLVLVAHDAILVSLQSGRVKSVTLDGSSRATSVTLDETIAMEAGKSYAARFWRLAAGGESVYAPVSLAVGEATTIIFTTPIPAASVPAVGDMFSFGEAGIETARCIVVGYEIAESLDVKLYVVDEAPGVHTADSGTIPIFYSRISRPASAEFGPPTYTVPAIVDEAQAETKAAATAAASTAAAAAAAAAAAQAAIAAIPQGRYIGRYSAAHPTPRVNDDSWTVYDTDAGDDGRPANGHPERGVWFDLSGTPTRITTASAITLQAKFSAAIADIAWAEANGYGEAADYGFDSVFQTMGAVAAFISSAFITHLLAQYLKIQTGGSIRGGDRYNADGSDGTVSATGFFLGADGTLKGRSATFENGTFTGSFNGAVATNQLVVSSVTAGENIVRSSNAEVSTTSITYVKLKEMQIAASGTIRVAFDLRGYVALAYGRIYVNGTAIGTERSNLATETTYNEDISVNAGDLVQIYAKRFNSGTGTTCYVNDFRIKIAQSPGILAFLGNP